MLNNKNDLSMIPTINNDGHSYIIPMDMYKEGYWAYNISNYFKARVDDNGTPFMIRWYKHGQLANVLNLRPFIRGRVGGYTIDDSNATADPKIVMDEDASSIDWTGETTDTQAGGIAIYRTVNQCYPQDGIFYGQVGLRSSDGDTVVTGIDIIFKVLDGNVNMLGAKKYYVSELTKALLDFEAKMDQHDRDYQAKLTQQEQEYQAKMDQNDKDFKSKTAQLIDDARDAYTKETQNTHDALAAAQAQIQANRDEQADLSNRLAGTEQQIKIHNVATIDQFTAFSKQALERLGSIDAQPKYYDTVDAMKAANPNGTNELCETVNDGHRWLYINGVWQDCGAVTDNAFKAARDASQDVLYGQSILDWQKNAASGSIVQATEDFAQYQDKPIMHLHSVQAGDYVFLESQVIEVKSPKVSIQCPTMLRNAQVPWSGYIEIHQFAPEDDPVNGTNWKTNNIGGNFNNPDLSLRKFGHFELKPETNRIQVLIGIHGIGDAYVGTPMINYGDNYLPYTPQDLATSRQSEKKIAATEAQNLLYGKKLEDFQFSSLDGVTQEITTLNDFPGTRILHVKSDKATAYLTLFVPVESKDIALQLPAKAINSIVSIKQYRDLAAQEQIGNEIFLSLSHDAELNKFEAIKLEDSTKYILLVVTVNANGELYMGMPKINYGTICIPYNFYEIANNNQLAKFPFNTGSYDTTSLIFTRNDNGSISYDTYNHHADYPNVDYNILPINSKIIALQLNYASTGNLNVQLRFNKSFIDDGFSSKTYVLPTTNNEFRNYKVENIHVPDGTVSFFVRIYPADGVKGTFKDLEVNKGVTVSQTSITTKADLMNQITIPRLYIQNNYAAYNAIVPFEYFTSKEELNGYINYDIQGDSSRNYVKKNLKIKLFKDAEGKEKLKVRMKSTWSKDNKYNLKANWIDATQARNVVNARLIRDAVALTPLENPKQTAPILQTEGLGQIDGFPIEVYFDGNFYGLFTLNTKKSEVTFNMDSKVDTNEVISTELGAKDFTDDTKTIDGTSWSTEIHDEANDTLKANFFKFVNTSSDDDFKAQIHNYIDVKSVITEMLFGWLSHEYDYYSKSELLATWNNGAYWYLIPYDLDSTWGLDWDGSKISLDDDWFSLDPKNTGSAIISDENKLHERIFTLFKDDFKKQGQLLRSTVWTNAAIINKFKMFIDDIPESSFRKEREQYSYIPSLKLTSFKQIQSAVIERGNDFDSFLAQLS